jgi:UDP-glucose 4-epimerase
MSPLRVLVTGATGQLGRYVQDRFQTLDRFACTFVPGPSGGGPNLANTSVIRELVADARPDIVLHLAGLVGGACEADSARTASINVDAVDVLARSAADAGATRFIFASSAAVYGDQASEPVLETAPTKGRSAYAESKIAAEQILEGLDTVGLDRVSLRIFNVYGAGFAGSLVERLLAATAENPITLNGLDGFVRDYVHAEDVAAAFEASVSAPGGFRVYNVGSGEPISNRELVRRLERHHPLHYLVTDGQPSFSCADISLARRELGFAPRLLA